MRAEERRANGRYFHCKHDPRHVDNEEELNHQENLERFSRGLAGCEEEIDREEGGSIAFAKRIGFTLADSLI